MEKPIATDQPTFTHKKKTYKVLLNRVNIPGIGVVSATDIASDVEAQKYLVENNAIGSVIALVVE
jgi:Asp-tRNA(Asn)/Glu-tRNA(Gln) amidotransferase B subunit